MPDVEPSLPGCRRDPTTTWTRMIADEYWADAVTPLMFSALGEWIDVHTTKALDRILGFRSIPDDLATLRLYRSHVYWNAETLARTVDTVPRFARAQQFLAYFPPSWRPRLVAAPFRPVRRIRAERRARKADPNGTIQRNHLRLAEHMREVDEACGQIDELLSESDGLPTLDKAWDELFALGVRHFEVIRWGMAVHSAASNLILAALLRRWLGDDGTLHRTLVTGLEGNLTLGTNAEIWRLGRSVAGFPSLLGTEPAPAALEGLEEGRELLRELDRFLAGHGHRAFTREISAPRWSETPEAVLEMVWLVARAPGDADPTARLRDEVRTREGAERRVDDALERMPFGRRRRRIVRSMLRYAQAYTLFRENQRFYLDKILLRVRRVVLAWGRHLAEAGLLRSADDVFFLTYPEVADLRGGRLHPADAASLVTERRGAYERERDVLPPPYLVGDEPVPLPEAGLDRGVLHGVSGSPGAAEGFARIIRSPREADRLRPGDILVASTTDPGWTPLFLGVSGVVLETGGLLGHGAILARECGIPAVVGLAGATAKIPDGARVAVDGSAGRVRILP